MAKGQKLTKGEKFDALTQRVEQLEMSTRFSQMMLQQIGNTVQPIQKDISEIASRQRDLQYRLLAYQELTNISREDVDTKTKELQLVDFVDLNKKDDEEQGYLASESGIVEDNSVIVITSETPESNIDAGILRSKMVLSEVNNPELREALLGKKLGETTEFDLSGVKHVATILDIKIAPVVEEEIESVQVAATGEESAQVATN